MKNKEEILQKIEQLGRDNLLNEDRKQYFSNLLDVEAVEMYERMIKTNDTRIDMLLWMLS